MVCSGVAEEARQRVHNFDHKPMAMGPERSKSLHNFELPCLRWGKQRYLRCMKVNPADDAIPLRSPSPRIDASSITRRRELEENRRLVKDSERRVRIAKRKIEDDGDGVDKYGIEAVREKLMYDLKTATDKIKDAIPREEAETAAAAEPEEVRPWNLRTRRAALKAPINDGGGGRGLRIEDKKLNYSPPLRSEGNNDVMSPRLRGEPEKKRAKFVVSLSKKEIEEDFMAMRGERPARRPKKRLRNVQKGIDSLFPGLWLTEISVDSYKVPEFPDSGKR